MQCEFTKWVSAGLDRAMLGHSSYAYELKLVRMWRKGVNGLRFSELPDHELKSLLQASGDLGAEAWDMYRTIEEHGNAPSAHDTLFIQRAPSAPKGREGWGLNHKISDSAIGFKPCDGFVIRNGVGWLVVGYDYGFKCVVWAMEGSRYVREVYAQRGGRGSLTVEDMERHGVLCWVKEKGKKK